MEDKILEHLGLLIKQARSIKQISQEELAWRCGITKNGLAKIFNCQPYELLKDPQ